MTPVQQILRMGRPDSLIADSKDWVLIEDALVELTNYGYLSPSNESEANIIRVVFEQVYYMGYLRGQNERAKIPDFVVADESA